MASTRRTDGPTTTRESAETREIDVTDRQPRSTDAPIPTARPATPAQGNGSAIAALVTGLLSATFAFLVAPAIAAVIFGLVAIILGVKGFRLANTHGGLHKGLAVSGLVSGVLGLLLGIAVIAGGITLYNELDQSDLPDQLQQLVD